MSKFEIIEVTPGNIDRYGIGCIRNKDHPGVREKISWYRKNYHTGLRIKLLYSGGRVSGFIEYVLGEYAWRPVMAENHLFIHCIWVYSTKSQKQGFGSALIESCVEDARRRDKLGVATVTSKGSWLADERIFLQNGFEKISSKDRYDLLLLRLKKGRMPEFLQWESQIEDFPGTQLILSHQCPANAKAVHDIEKIAKEESIKLKINILKNYCDARRAPTGFGVFQLVHNGKVLEDHYISGIRFRNIVKKEIKKNG
jgi:hypothetical protein